MRHTRLLTVAALVIGAITVACGGRAVETSAGEVALADTTTSLVVDNRGFADMTIYVLEGSSRRRLGTANGNSRTRIPLPRTLVGNGRDLQFLADPLGGTRSSVSQRIFVAPGDKVGMTIMP